MLVEYPATDLFIPFIVVIGVIVAVWCLLEYMAYKQVSAVRKANEINWKKGLRLIKNGEGIISLQEFRVVVQSPTKNEWDATFRWCTLGVYDDTDEGRELSRKRYLYYMDEMLKTRRAMLSDEERRKAYTEHMDRINFVIDDITNEILGK